MDPRFMHRIVDMRRILNFAFVVTSAARCSAYNATVSSTGVNGPHTPLILGDGAKAMCHSLDFAMYGYQVARLESMARQHGITGIGLSQKGPHNKRFIHLDDLPEGIGRPRPWTWTY